MAAVELQLFIEVFAVCQHHSTLARRDDLHGVKGKDRHVRILARADFGTEIVRARRMRRVLEHGEAVFLCERVDAHHVARLPREMHGHDDLRQTAGRARGGELLLQHVRVHVVRRVIDVDKIDIRAAVAAAVRRGRERDGRRPEHVALREPRRAARDVERRCRIRHGDGVFRAAIRRDTPLEALDGRPLRQEIRPQHRLDSRDVRIIDVLFSIKNHDSAPLTASSRAVARR